MISTHSNTKTKLQHTAGILFWILLWQIGALLSGNALILPSPLQTLGAFAELIARPDFYYTLSATLVRVFAGVFFSLLAGFALGIASAFSSWVRAVLEPFVSVVRSVPVVSVIILLNLWLGSALVPLFVCFLVCFPIAWTNALEGVRATDSQLVEMAQFYRVPFLRQLHRLYLPALKPYFTASVMNGAGMGWKATVTAEVLAAAIPSIGMRLYYSKIYLETPELFAWTLAVVLCSMGIESLIKRSAAKA